MERIYISYKDDDDKRIVKGNFELIKETEQYFKIKSNRNEITIPINRILKVKKELKGGINKI